MNTSKSISTISYNSEDFLLLKLKELYNNRMISDYMYILHSPEDDELKFHIHLWIQPNKKIDTVELQEMFKEVDPNNPKPLGCIDFRKSDIDNWILYNQHFRPYLVSKLEDRKKYYQKEDFRFFDEDTFNYNYLHAFKSSDWAKQTQINTLLSDSDFAPADLILNGVLPLQNANSLLSLVRLQQQGYGETLRNGRTDTHE